MKTISTPSTDRVPPRPGPALVVDRWTTWVRLWFPETGTTTWVDLAEIGFEHVRTEGPSPPSAN